MATSGFRQKKSPNAGQHPGLALAIGLDDQVMTPPWTQADQARRHLVRMVVVMVMPALALWESLIIIGTSVSEIPSLSNPFFDSAALPPTNPFFGGVPFTSAPQLDSAVPIADLAWRA